MVSIIESREQLDKAISEAGEKLVVIDFFANWCGPCKIISSKLEELSNQYADKAVVLKVNVDDNDELAVDYNVTSMPTFVFIKNQQIIDIFVGGNPDKLTKNMEKYISGIEISTASVENNLEELPPSGGRSSIYLDTAASNESADVVTSRSNSVSNVASNLSTTTQRQVVDSRTKKNPSHAIAK